MSKKRCWNCRLPIPVRAGTKKREGPWELIEGSGKWWCQPCIILRIYAADVAEANRNLDQAMSEHLRHERMGVFAGCPLCAVTA